MAHPARNVPSSQTETFPLAWRRRLRDGHGVVLDALNVRTPAIATLSPLAWLVFHRISARWQLNADALIGQARIAYDSHCAIRSVRSHVGELCRSGMLVLHRGRHDDGTEWIRYAPGPVFLAALGAFCEQPPALRLLDSRSEPTHAPAAAIAAGPAARIAGEAVITDPEKSSSRELSRPPPSTKPVEEQEASIELARELLELRLDTKYGDGPRPAIAPADLELATARVRELRGDLASKRMLVRDAVDGAFVRSKGAPSVRFLCASSEVLLDHADVGRRRRAAERQRPRAAVQSTAPESAPIPMPQSCKDELDRILGR